MRNSGVIDMSYVKTENNLAYPFTKGLSRNVTPVISKDIGLMPI